MQLCSCSRQLSLLYSVSIYFLVLIPQSLWLHSKSLVVNDVLCETCSVLLPGVATAQPEGPVDKMSVNLTYVYEQVWRGTCTFKDNVDSQGRFLEEESTSEVMDELEYGSDGGWSISHNLSDLTGPCNIERRNAGTLSQLEFLEKFSETRPVILEGVPTQTRFKRASTKWRLLADYGQDLITVATANTHSYTKTQMTLCDYVSHHVRPQSPHTLGNETLYHFGDNDRERWSPLFSLYQLPPYTLPGMEPVLSFGLAGPGTGVPFHIHGPTFAETIFGRKRWFLYPPDQSPEFDPDESTLRWVTHTLPSLPAHLTPLQCTLSPGEVSYCIIIPACIRTVYTSCSFLWQSFTL